VLRGETSRRIRSILRCKDGERVDVTMALAPCRNDAGEVVAVSVRYERLVTSMVVPRIGPPGLSAAPPQSGVHVNVSNAAQAVVDQLEAAKQMLSWLDERLRAESGVDDARRSLIGSVLRDIEEVVNDSQQDLRSLLRALED
jgi:hypothetical protein